MSIFKKKDKRFVKLDNCIIAEKLYFLYLRGIINFEQAINIIYEYNPMIDNALINRLFNNLSPTLLNYNNSTLEGLYLKIGERG